MFFQKQTRIVGDTLDIRGLYGPQKVCPKLCSGGGCGYSFFRFCKTRVYLAILVGSTRPLMISVFFEPLAVFEQVC